MTSLPVALAQITVPDDPVRARDVVGSVVREAAGGGARLVVLPEASMTPFGTDLTAAAREHGPAFERLLTDLATELDLVVVAGSFAPTADGRVHNVVHVRGPLRDPGRGAEDGAGGTPEVALRADYRKIHLYDAFGSRESETVAPGTELVRVRVDGIEVGIATCYDVRFPEQFVALARRGAQVIALPMAWGDGPGKAEQLRVLLRARALDCTSFVLAADQAPPLEPTTRAPRGVAGSAVVSPLGEILAEAGAGPRVVQAVLDLDEVARAREILPVLAGRARLE
jgi:predicted amidohydrolase